MPTVAKLAVQAATYAIDKAYDYLLPTSCRAGSAAACWSPSDAATASARA